MRKSFSLSFFEWITTKIPINCMYDSHSLGSLQQKIMDTIL